MTERQDEIADILRKAAAQGLITLRTTLAAEDLARMIDDELSDYRSYQDDD